jgi:hypothetical protein
MSYSLNAHERGYGLSSIDVLLTAVSLSGKVYADRHWELSNREEVTGRLGHRVIAVLESILFFGALVALIERVVVFVLTKFTEIDKVSPDKNIRCESSVKQETNQTTEINIQLKNEPSPPLIIQAMLLVLRSNRRNGILENEYKLNPYNPPLDEEKEYPELLRLISLIPSEDINQVMTYKEWREGEHSLTLLNQIMATFAPQSQKRLQLAELLLKKGADPRIKGYYGSNRTALEIQLGSNLDDDRLKDLLADAVCRLETAEAETKT